MPRQTLTHTYAHQESEPSLILLLPRVSRGTESPAPGPLRGAHGAHVDGHDEAEDREDKAGHFARQLGVGAEALQCVADIVAYGIRKYVTMKRKIGSTKRGILRDSSVSGQKSCACGVCVVCDAVGEYY